jgi:uncharacterized coiled-coil protein SlyX
LYHPKSAISNSFPPTQNLYVIAERFELSTIPMSEELESRLDELESVVERQQERIEEQAETIETQQETIEEQHERLAWLDEFADEELSLEDLGDLDDLEDVEEQDGSGIDRRSAMKAGGLLALAGLGAGTAGAAPTGQVGTSNRPLNALYTEEVVGNLFDFDGSFITLESFEDGNTGNDVFAISSTDNLYGTPTEQMTVDQLGNVDIRGERFAAGRGATADQDGTFVVGDSTSTSISPSGADEARFQQDLVSEGSITANGTVTANGFFDFDGNLMELEAFEDGNTGNDVFSVSSATGAYGTLVEQFEVNQVGDATVAGSLSVGGDGSEQRTAGPIAKGYVPADPSSNSPNTVNVNDVSWNSSQGRYEIDIEGVDYDFRQYATVITSVSTGVTFDEGSVSGRLIAEPSNGSQTRFNFATYDL